MKLWKGRKGGESAAFADEYISSLKFDYKLYWQHILTGIAHVKMLGEKEILTKYEAEKISSALVEMLADIEKGAIEISDAEDIHTFVESELIKKIGEVGKKLQTASSRSDFAATELRLYVKDSIVNIATLLRVLINTLVKMASDNIKYYMPSYRHMQKSQPVSIAHYLNSYSEMFLRDVERLTDCFKRTDVMPLGSCSSAGTSYPIDRKITAKYLSFSEISTNAMDAVSDRDFAAEYLFCLSTVAMHLSRFTEDLILFSSDTYKFIVISDAYAVSSIANPVKKNPEILEIIRGKSGKTFGNLISMLTILKGLATSYNKDITEEKELVFASEEIISGSLKIFTELIQNISFDIRAMRNAATNSYSGASYIADYLVDKGMPFNEANETTGQIIKACVEQKLSLERVPLNVLRVYSLLFEEDILELIKIRKTIENKTSFGGTARVAVRENIRNIVKRLNRMFKEI